MKDFAQLKDQSSHALCSGNYGRGGLTIRKSIWGEGEHDRVGMTDEEIKQAVLTTKNYCINNF